MLDVFVACLSVRPSVCLPVCLFVFMYVRMYVRTYSFTIAAEALLQSPATIKACVSKWCS